MASKEDKQSGDPDDVSFLRTEDYICLNCSVITQTGVSRRMALAAEAFGNKMCFLEDISAENVTPDLPSCIFVLEQALSVRALQEVVNSTNNSSLNSIQQSGHRTLLYGHAILLRHLQSNMYLTCLSTSTSNDKLAFDVGLQHDSQGESCWWTIHPASKQRSEGEKVRIGDDIILVSVASERYLHIYTVDSVIHRVNASFQQTLWTLLPISSGNTRSKNAGFVFGGEVLRLFHGNMDQCFTLPQPGVSEHPYSIFYEAGTVCGHARSLWRLEFLRTRWYGGFMNWNAFVRLRHITSGRYLGVLQGEIAVIHRDKATADAITFILMPSKDDKRSSEVESEETMGSPLMKYGDTLVYLQHVKSSCWVSYQTYETKKRGVGKIEEKKAALNSEGHMDDCFTIVRAQEEEARSALVIRKCMSLFTKFIRAMDLNAQAAAAADRGAQLLNKAYWKKISLEKVLKCLDDLIEFFAQPPESCTHEERQNKLKALRNRQDLFHEEGMITLVLETIDKYSETKDQSNRNNIPLFDGYKQQVIDDIYDQLYALLATMIKGNRNNCAQFAQGNRLDCLISRLTSQQTSRGVLEVLHCILIDSPEALNMIKERHIQGIISLLDRNGRDPKVLSVLSSLCANKGIAVRTNQNLICDNLLPRRDLLIQSRLIRQTSSIRPNIMVGVIEGESMYKKWYFEVEIDYIEEISDPTTSQPESSAVPPHCRIGWATTEYYATPDGSDGFECVGVGDDCHSYGFDGRSLWFAGRSRPINDEFGGFRRGDVVGCLLDLSIPEIWFSLNGVPMKGFFREFSLTGMFYPVISVSPKISCRFLFGDEHGRFKSGPPEGCAPIYQAMLAKQKIKLYPCFTYGDMAKTVFTGPPQPLEQIAFTPQPVDISQIQMPGFIDSVRDKLAENLHEIWAMSKIENGWRYADFRNDNKKIHNCLCQFELLPRDEKQYDTTLATDTLKTMYALGYQLVLENRQDQKRIKLIKLPNSYLQLNGYKPQPLDLNNITLNAKLELLVERLAENTHNVWAKEKIKAGWTYGVIENDAQKRHPYLLPYDKVDANIKKANRETASDTVKTLLAYGYQIEPPSQEFEDNLAKRASESKEKLKPRFTTRTYRAEKTYAISSGKWYYECELLSAGSVKIGWSLLASSSITDIAHCPYSYSFECQAARKWHQGSDAFGKQCQQGDVVGVMIDLQDKTVCFSLNGEFLMDALGSECAFEKVVVGDDQAYVPSFTLGQGQKIRLNFGQDVNSLRYFTQCGLQEGYEPFGVNMTKNITFWYSNEIPIFETIDEQHESLEINKNFANESTPSIKLISKSFGSGKTKMEYLRLSLPVTFHDEFVPKAVIREKRMNALAVYKSQIEEEAENVQQQMFNFEPIDYKHADNKSDTLDSNQLITSNQSNASGTSAGSKPISSFFNKLTHGSKQNARSKSPFKFMQNRLSREPSPMAPQGGPAAKPPASRPPAVAPTKAQSAAAAAAAAAKVTRSSEFGIKPPAGNQPAQTQAAIPPPAPTTVAKNIARKSIQPSAFNDDYQGEQQDYALMESDDVELQAIIDYVDEYYYGVRIFPGQDASKVYIGWTTSRFHLLADKIDRPFDAESLISKCTLINTSADGSILSSLTRKECYVVCVSELTGDTLGPDSGGGPTSKRITTSLLIGCQCDLATGQLTFTVNGKEATGAQDRFQVEPGTKLYPAVFVEPTTKEILQFELGRVKNCLPLSAALFPSLGKHVHPKCPPRLKLQFLNSIGWSRVPNVNLKVHTLKMNNVLGWSLLCEESVDTQAIFIPEEDRWISILELNENDKFLEFYHSMLQLYEAVCAQSNNYVAHQVCKLIDERQLMYCIQNQYMSGPLRKGFYDLLIKLHLESFVNTRSLSKYEFIVPLSRKLTSNQLAAHFQGSSFPSKSQFVSVRPQLSQESDIKNEEYKLYLVAPPFNLASLRAFVLASFCESVKLCASHARDPIGGSNAFLFVPLIKMANQLIVMDVFSDEDINTFLSYMDPQRFVEQAIQAGTVLEEGLLKLNLDDDVKYEICKLLHSLCDYILRNRVEAIVSFSSDFVKRIQSDQRRRYNELKESTLPSAIMAKKTREFRCPARDQMQTLVNFKSSASKAIDISEDIKSQLQNFHQCLNRLVQIKEREQENDNSSNETDSKSFIGKTISFIFSTEYYNSQLDSGVSELSLATTTSSHASSGNELVLYYDKARGDKPWNSLSMLITECVIEWAKKSFIYNENLIREMFHLVYRQYNSLGEIAECLRKTYVLAETSIKDVKCLLQSLSTVRNLLYVQMSPFEEEIMRSCLNEIMDNKVFFQHPDLMRALCVHETVMQVMINWLNRRQHQQDTDSSTAAAAVAASGAASGAQSITLNNQALPAAGTGEVEPPKEENTELVVVCCKFLSYFCRTSRHNQRAMFENFSYLLDNSAMLLARPSLRGSCPLDVACSSLMDNNDLSLALRESDLEKIAAYLSRCGLQTNSELLAKGYPDIGWDPVEGERFLDFLKFCVWVNGDSVEENANLIVRLLIRRPECLGPALRGEGGGLLKATIDGIRMSLQIAATQNLQNPIVTSSLLDVENELGIDFMNENKFDFGRIPSDEDEDYIDYGEAILAFYASLVELLGRCAPSEETIKMGKSDSIRGRSILRSLVSMEDLEGVLSLRFILPIPQQQALNEHLPGIQPTHKMSIVLFLERVYGIPDEDTFFRLLETGFLPDIRCATVLDASNCVAEGDMALALNRYLCCSVLPLLTSYSHFFGAENAKTTLMETVLNIVYRLCRCKSLTKGQLDIVCDFLVAFTNQMKPGMMRNLLRKLIQDLPTLEEYTIVPLRMLTLWYERCGRYYGSSPIGGMQASEEEKRLTMTLFTRIFDALAKRTYDPELFSKALPCLSAIGSALSPDYSYYESKSDGLGGVSSGGEDISMSAALRRQYTLGGASGTGENGFEPEPMQVASITLSNDMEEIIKSYSEHVHDFWSHDRFEDGWSYGETYNDSVKSHPLLKAFQNLPRKDQLRYEDLSREALKVIKALGWSIEMGEGNLNLMKNASRINQKKLRDGLKSNGYQPKPFDLSNITLTREQDELAIILAVNCHHIWARRKKNDLENMGAALHHKIVPYDLLTDREKASDLQFSFELVKFLILNGYRLQNYEANLNENRNTFKMHHEDSDKLNSGKNEVRFAYNLLEKLLEYVDKAAINMQSIKESARFSRKSSFKTSGQDVKFFTKVVLPLIEKYFKSHRSYFILKSNSTKSGSGCATFKEKEMTCSLFCKLALLIRKKLACFGSDSKITVRCLQVLIRAVDVSSVIKNSQEIVRASLLPFFSYAADDLTELINDLQLTRLANVKGTSQKPHANLDYIHMVLLPVLSSMFDHLGVNQYGCDVLTGEIQVASYKALNALWILGTQNLIERDWVKFELHRHRPQIGECLGAFSAAFPIAFLEPQFNLNNRYSIMYGLSASNLSEHSLEGQDIMNKLAKNLPSLQDIINEIGRLCESGGKYEDAPHAIEVLLPTICSYLTHWWSHGSASTAAAAAAALTSTTPKKPGDPHHQPIPAIGYKPQAVPHGQQGLQQPGAAADQLGVDDRQLTAVTSDLMNQVLGYILQLISNNFEEKNAPWMNSIASFSQSIISSSTSNDLLERNFLPVSAKIVEKARELIQREMSMKTFTRNIDSADRETIESDLQKDFEVFIRNIYAFYPLLIKYVDLQRAHWLKNPDVYSEQLYYNIAEVFSLWLSSKMFKREETNFVSANDIDNMMLIMPKSAQGGATNAGGANTAGGASSSGQEAGYSQKSGQSDEGPRKPGDKKKKRGQKGETKKFTSLIVACLKRLLPIGINFFEGKEQEMIQMAKQKFIDIKSGNDIVGMGAAAAAKQKAIQLAAQNNSSDDQENMELNKDQEDVVEDFIRRYMKSSESFGEDGNGVGGSGGSATENGGGAIDKETYQKTKWQRMLYRKIASKRHLVSTMQNISEENIIARIMDIAKVLYGLHMVEHPLVKTKGTWRKLISGQRKKAVMACFRMAPLYSIPHHRAINLFLKSYKQNWLDNEAENDTDIACLIPDLCPEEDVVEEPVKVDSGESGEGGKAVEAAGGKPTGAAGAGGAGAAPGGAPAAPGEQAQGEGGGESAELATLELEALTPDPLRQLISTFNRAATTDSSALQLTEDPLYQCYATIMSRSCEIEEEDDDEDEMPEEDVQVDEEDQAKTFKEEEMQKQKLLYEQGRLADRGAAEMCLLYISASKGEKSEMLEKTLELGISLLHGGNISVQARMLKHLKDKKDVGFFTSLAGLMANCSVLDLDTFERCIKAEQFGGVSNNDADSGMAGKKNLHDADFTCSLFRFLQLLCEGHNLEFQNYLRMQPGNNTIVNTIICTVDYLLRLQESIMDFYWHYSGKSTVDAAGKENFCRAINVAKQVFNTLTEYIQGPCIGNQLTLAHSRLWDAIGGFLYIFANLQDKLSKDPHQIELLRELMKLQKDMIIMLLSMLEGNVLNGPIGKQMVDTLIENQQNVEMLLKFFDIFLKMKDLTTSEAFQEFDTNGDGWISPKEFKKAMEAQKMYSGEEIDYILMCVDTNQDGKIDFKEFTERFHNPAKDIGFNMAVLLTNLSEHMSHDARLDRLMKKASSFLTYFEPYLGRIEITGSSGKIERVYFEIKESNIEQWNKPQIKESKRQFLYDIVNEGDDKEKLEHFVNFCEDTIFEMQHAASMSVSNEEEGFGQNGGPEGAEPKKSYTRLAFEYTKFAIFFLFQLLSPSRIRQTYRAARKMSYRDFAFLFISLIANTFKFSLGFVYSFTSLIFRCLYLMITGTEAPTSQSSRDETMPLLSSSSSSQQQQQSSQQSSSGLGGASQNGAASSQSNSNGIGGESLSAQQHRPSFALLPDPEEYSSHQSMRPFGLAGISEKSDEPLDGPGNGQELVLPENAASQDPNSLSDEQGLKSPSSQKTTSSIKVNNLLEEPEEDLNLNAARAEPASSPMANYKSIMFMFARNFYKLKYLALVLAFLINFFMLFYKARKMTQDGLEPSEDADEDELVEIIMMDPEEYYIEHMLKALAFVHSLVAFSMMVAYYVLKVPLVIFKREKEIARKLEFQGLWIAEQPSDDDLRSHWDKLVLSTRTFPDMYWDKFVKKKVKTKYQEQFDLQQLSKLLGLNAQQDEYKFGQAAKAAAAAAKAKENSQGDGFFSKLSSIDWRYQIWKWGVIFTDNLFLYVFWYFAFSVFGNFNYFFFACHLLDVAISIKTLTTILKSITHNGKQLLLTIMLMSVIVYMYTVIAFNFFRKFYSKEEEGEIEENCQDLFTCFKFHLYIGIRSGGGIGDELESPVGDGMEFYRIIFDITFFFFIIVILLAIIQGLIIDAFGELRDQLEQVKESLEASCFICGIGKEYFDKIPHGFEIHTMREHNFANYMYFLMHLINKPDTEYTGQETYVWQLYEQRCWDFFPAGDCFRKQHESDIESS